MHMAVITRHLGRGGTAWFAGVSDDGIVYMIVVVMSEVRTMFRYPLRRVLQGVANARHASVRYVERKEQRQQEDDETAHMGRHHIIRD